jgi:SAM-dependent methyltransferase
VDEAFDAIVSTDVLEHVLDLNRTVSAMLRVLKAGGIMIVRVPYREWLGLYLMPDYPFRYAHLRNFDEFSLTFFFERVMGCKVEEWTPGGHMLAYELFKYRVPKITYNIIDFIAWLGRVSPKLHRMIVIKTFHPIEVNFVVRKPLQ